MTHREPQGGLPGRLPVDKPENERGRERHPEEGRQQGSDQVRAQNLHNDPRSRTHFANNTRYPTNAATPITIASA